MQPAHHTSLGRRICYSLAAVVMAFSSPVLAADLSVLGAEVGANSDGSIPAWTGGLSTPPSGFDPSKGYKDPFATEKPLFVIDQTNLGQYQDKLTAGQVALLKRYANYKIPVYPSHRTAAFSADMLKAVAAEAGQIKMIHNGNALQGVQASSVPFPKPSNGLEVIWNTLLRRPAQSLESYTASFIAGPGVRPTIFASNQTIAWAPALGKGGSNLLFGLMGQTTKPAAQAGEALLVMDTLNFVEEPRLSWIVNPGQRRVIRAPELVHSAPAGNSDALRTVDDIYGFNGSPERFEWKLLGKKEMFIPYNNYRMSDKSLKYTDMIQDAFLKPDLTRFELHRVWVVEGTLKAGQEHIYSKRTLYIDEDSWYVALMDQYDNKGELWRIKMLYLMQAYDAPGMYAAGEVQHDMNARKSVFSGFHNEEQPTRFNVPVKAGDFSPAALRRFMR